jgi:hypothetical protein
MALAWSASRRVAALLTASLFVIGCTAATQPDGSLVTSNGSSPPGTSTGSPGDEAVDPPLGTPLDDERVAEVLGLLLEPEPEPELIEAAFQEIAAQRDVRFIAPLIELVRAGPMRLAAFDPSQIELLEELAGVRHGRDWDRWAEWYARTSLAPPPGFTGWKGRLFAGIDERFTEFLRDDVPAAIRVETIVWGGVPVDGITPLDRPPVLRAAEADYLDAGEPVFGLVVNGEARAYPLRIMDAHEMANDMLGGVPVSLAYCTLCGTGIAYDGRGPDGVTYTFSTSGLLYENNKLMYDRQTGTLWHQFIGSSGIGRRIGSSTSSKAI